MREYRGKRLDMDRKDRTDKDFKACFKSKSICEECNNAVKDCSKNPHTCNDFSLALNSPMQF